MTRTPTILFLASAALALTACDAVTQVAGDAIKGEIRTQFIAQCEQVAEDNGIASTNVSAACECSADALAEDAADGQLELDQAKIEEVLKSCVSEQAASGDAAPAAETGG